jgi:two-component system nitrogen regulation response regulator NtrX
LSAAPTRPNTILVVDDEQSVRRSVMGFLEDESYRPIGCESASEALATLDSEQIDLALIDVWMDNMDGIQLLGKITERWPDLPVIMMSGHGSIDLAVQATRKGAYDFLEKPLQPEKLAITISRALDHRTTRRAQEILRQELGSSHALLGESPALVKLREDIRRVAGTDGRVLVTGENGTGKELVARAIHELSPRRRGPFVRLNSAAIPRDLVESEMFGHERGAFTGATARKRGKFELADRGTLFLDEIGDMEPAAQSKLLRALETGEVERVGGTHPVRFDVRVLTATNKDLKREIAEGRFREDLYYRLAVVLLNVVPLRERGDDIALLANHFLIHYCQEFATRPKTLTSAALDHLRRYRWPGNVRELRNLTERLSIMVEKPEIDVGDLLPLLDAVGTPEASHRTQPSTGTLRDQLDEQERQILERELRETQWNVSESARRLGIDRASLHRKIRRFGLSKEMRSA